MNNEILLMSYWEHFKAAKDLALIYPPEHPQRQKVEAELQLLQQKLSQSK
jgi:hypothetical protein